MKIIFYIINCFDCTNLFTNLKMQVTIHSVFQIYKIGVLKKKCLPSVQQKQCDKHFIAETLIMKQVLTLKTYVLIYIW